MKCNNWTLAFVFHKLSLLHWLKKIKGEEKVHQTYKLFGTSSMNQHVEIEHHELLFAYLLELVAIVDGISRGSEEGSQLL